jgi:hypothetical protein
MTARLYIALLLCIFSINSQSQDSGGHNIQCIPQMNDTGIYVMKVRVQSMPFFGCGCYTGCHARPVLCKVISSSNSKFLGRFIPIIFTSSIAASYWSNSTIYKVVMQSIGKDKIKCGGPWKQDTCTKKVYWGMSITTTNEKDYRPFIEESDDNRFSRFRPKFIN